MNTRDFPRDQGHRPAVRRAERAIDPSAVSPIDPADKDYVNADIRPKVSGYIPSQPYKEGSLVHEGDLLFQIDPKQFQAALDQAQAGLAQARGDLQVLSERKRRALRVHLPDDVPGGLRALEGMICRALA